ncbi:MAG: hypothetical protein BWY57_03389 [Betaproteobacteria bacterium ADurb.Bin341]|nr:MAG: hypothetical protein BWY57_03389 [Betaproteobacteria bacterium ADurb.Bin341]
MAFIDQNKPVAAQIRQFSLNLCDRHNVCAEPVFLFIVLPHVDQVLGADNERFDAVVILKDAGERSRHQRLAQADHVADHDAAALVQVMSGDFDCRFLEVEESVAEIARDAELRQTGAGLLRQMVGGFDVDVVWGNCDFTRPTLIDDGDELVRDVHAKAVGPSVFKPLRKLVAGVMIHHIDVQLALFGEPREGQVAAAQIPDLGIQGVLPEE